MYMVYMIYVYLKRGLTQIDGLLTFSDTWISSIVNA